MNGGFLTAEKAEHQKPAGKGDKEEKSKPIYTISPIKIYEGSQIVHIVKTGNIS